MTAPTAYPAAVSQLSSQIPATVTLEPDALAHYDGSIDAAEALAQGAQIESVSVLDEVLRVGGIAMPSILTGTIGGYGPLRMRYFIDLAASLADKVAELDASRVKAAGAGTARTTSLRDSRSLRNRAVRVLKNLAGRRPEENARLAQARKEEDEKPDERTRSLGALALPSLGSAMGPRVGCNGCGLVRSIAEVPLAEAA